MKPKNLIKIWNQVPPDYYQKGIRTNPLQRYWHNQKVETLRNVIGKKKFEKILDVGCASGRMANEISKIYPNAKVSGVDVYEKALKYGRKKYPHLKFIKGDAHRLPFKNNFFDLVICYEVIEHVVDPERVLKEIKRVIKKDGLGIVAMDSGNLLFRIVWWIWEKTYGHVWQGAHLNPFRHSELEFLIKKSGLAISKKQFSHFGMELSFLIKK